MRTLYLECAMGAAGDMLMAALYELLEEKDAFLEKMNSLIPGVVVTALGALALLAIALVRWIMAGKPVAKIDWNRVGKAAYCVVSLLVLGAGMAMIMAFEGLMIPGMLVGVVGIVLMLGMIPVFKGLK